jgi:hypothetical protein
MIKLHKHFGIKFNYNEIVSLDQIKTAIEEYDMVCIDNVNFSCNSQQLLAFVKELGQVLDFSKSLENKGSLWCFPRDSIGVEINVSNGQEENMAYHQDGYWYSLENKTYNCMSIDLTAIPYGEKVSDTIFYSTRIKPNTVSPEMLSFLKTLIVSNFKMEADPDPSNSAAKRKQLIKKLYQKYNTDSVKLKKFVHRYNRCKKQPLHPGEFLVKELINDDCICWSPAGDPIMVNLNSAENIAISNYINQLIFQPQNMYCHTWIPNQLVLWNNNSLIHSRLSNATSNNVRTMYRVQFKI